MNFLLSFICLIGKERMCCNSTIVMYLAIIEFAILVFTQIVYFKAQMTGCMEDHQLKYFWLMGQIFALYIGLGVTVCTIFRKNCQDPALSAESKR